MAPVQTAMLAWLAALAGAAPLKQGNAFLLSQLRARRRADSLLQRTAVLRQGNEALGLLQGSAALFDPNDADAAARTLQNLDTNGNGKIDANEISSFAQAQGLDSTAAANELSSLDLDGDGALSQQELSGLLGGGDQTVPAAPAPLAAVQEQAPPPAEEPVQAPQLQLQAASQLPAQPMAQQVAQPAPTVLAAESVDVGQAVDAGLGDLGSLNVDQDVTAASLASVDASAGTNSAESAANVFVEQLNLEQQEEAAATELEHRAAELRANSTALSRRMIKSAMTAGTQAANQKAEEVLNTMLKLEAEETRKEIAAAALQAKAKAELREAHELMSIADSALLQAAPASPAA